MENGKIKNCMGVRWTILTLRNKFTEFSFRPKSFLPYGYDLENFFLLLFIKSYVLFKSCQRNRFHIDVYRYFRMHGANTGKFLLCITSAGTVDTTQLSKSTLHEIKRNVRRSSINKNFREKSCLGK